MSFIRQAAGFVCITSTLFYYSCISDKFLNVNGTNSYQPIRKRVDFKGFEIDEIDLGRLAWLAAHGLGKAKIMVDGKRITMNGTVDLSDEDLIEETLKLAYKADGDEDHNISTFEVGTIIKNTLDEMY
ncbi:hypothetical protein CL622_01815 [archaeon]|nr:hypothetical protein [archaeon]|tara:strand:- start:3328 stop:3711 length:384 start_codon:yes stop_codon:yes gene_type:complete